MAMNERQQSSLLSPLMTIEPHQSLHNSKPISDTALTYSTQHRRPCQTQEVIELDDDDDDDDDVQIVQPPQHVVEISSDEEMSVHVYNDNKAQRSFDTVKFKNVLNKSTDPTENSQFCSLVISEVTSLSKADFELVQEISSAEMQHDSDVEVHQSQNDSHDDVMDESQIHDQQRVNVDDPEVAPRLSLSTMHRKMELLTSACNMMLLHTKQIDVERAHITNEHQRTTSTNSSKNLDRGNPPSPMYDEMITGMIKECGNDEDQQNYQRKKENEKYSAFVSVRNDECIDLDTDCTLLDELAREGKSDDNDESEKKVDARKDQVSLQENDTNENPVGGSIKKIIHANKDENDLYNSPELTHKFIFIEGNKYIVLDDWCDQSIENKVDNTSNEFCEKVMETSMIVSSDSDPFWISNGEAWDTDEQIVCDQSSKNDLPTIVHDAANSSSFSIISTQNLVITETDKQQHRSVADGEKMHQSDDSALACNATTDTSSVHTRPACQVSDNVSVKNSDSCEIRCDRNFGGFCAEAKQAPKRQPEILRRDVTTCAEQEIIDRETCSIHNKQKRSMCRKEQHGGPKKNLSRVNSGAVVTNGHANKNKKLKIIDFILLLKKNNKHSMINLTAQFFLDVNFIKLIRQFNHFYQFVQNFYYYDLLLIDKSSLEINGQLKELAKRCDNRSNEKKVISQKMITNLPDENQNSFCKSYDNQQFDLYENGKRKHKSDDNRSISSIGEDEPCASEYSDTDSTNECQDVSKSIYQSPTSYVPCLTINKEPSENIQKKKGNSQTCSEMKLTLKRDGFNHENWIALPKENYAYHNVISHTNEIFPRPQEKVLQTNIYKETPELDSNVYAAPIKRNSYNIKINLAPRPIFGSKLDNQRSNNMQSEENSIKFYQSSECEKKEHFLKDSNDTSNHNKENEYIGRDQSLKKQEEKFSSDHHSLKKQEELDNESKTTTLLQFESKKYTNVKLVAENKMYMNSDAHNIIENIQDKCNTNSAYSESKKKSLSNEALILIPDCLKAARYDSGTSSLTCIELPPDDDSDDENRLRINIDDFETDSMYNKHLKNDDSYAPENNSCINQGKNTTSDITNSQVSDPRRNKQEDSLNNDEQLKIDKTDTKIINGNDEKMEVEISITNESKAKTLNKESIFCDLYYFGEGIFDCLPEYHCYGEETRQELISEYTKLYQDGKKSKLLKINKKKAFYQKRKTSNGDKVVEPSCKNLKLDEPDIELDQSKSIQNINEITHMESAILNENANCVLEDESPLHELEGGDFDYNYSQIVRNKEFSDRNLNDDYCLSDDEPNNSIKQSNLISVETVNHGHENFIRQDHLLEKNLYEVISNSSAIPSSSTKEIEKLNDDNLSNSFKMNNVLPKKNAVNGQEDQSKLCINMQEEITKFNSTSTKIKIYINKDVNSEDIFGKSTVPTTNVYLNTSINHTSNKNNLMQSNRAIDNNLSEEVSNIFSCSSTETSKHEHVKVTNSEKSKEVTIEYNHGIIENIVHSDTVKKDYCDLKVLSSHNLVLENFLPSNESVPYNEEYYTYHSMLDSLVSEKNLIVQSNSLSSALFIPVYLPTIVTYQQLPTSSYISSNQSVSNLPVSTSSTNSSTNLSKASTMTNEIKILPKASPMSNNVSSKSTTPTTSSSSLLTLLSTALNKPFIPPMAEVPSDNQRNETIKSIIIRASDFFQMNEGKSISEKKCFKNKNVSTELEIMLNNQSGGEGMDNSIEEFTENPTLSIKNLMVAVQKLYIFLKENWDSESSKFESYEELGPNSFRFLKYLIEINRYLLYTQHILQTDFINTVKAVDKILNNKPSPPTLNCVIKLYKKLVKQNIIRHDAIHVIHIPDINTMSEIIIKQILQYEEIVKTNNELVEKSSKKENVKAYPKHKHRDFEK